MVNMLGKYGGTAPHGTAGRAPVRVPGQTPRRAPVRVPSRAPGRAPGRALGRAPGRHPGGSRPQTPREENLQKQTLKCRNSTTVENAYGRWTNNRSKSCGN